MPKPSPQTQTFPLDLTKDEVTILKYVIAGLEYAGEPLKDTYELGDDEPKDPERVLKAVMKKIDKLVWKE